jgi:hypothetical protein
MYVHIGPDNGGVVLNLGLDGLALQAGNKLKAEMHTLLNLRLRGSGLNVGLAGELVWLGSTEKEAGISFTNLPSSVRQEIADWLARESELYGQIHGSSGGAQESPDRRQSGQFLPHQSRPAPPPSLHSNESSNRMEQSHDAISPSTISPSREDLQEASAEPAVRYESSSAPEPEPVNADRAAQPLEHVLQTTSPDRRVSDALLRKWKQLSSRRTVLLAGAGIACFATIVILAMVRGQSSFSASLWSAFSRQYVRMASLGAPIDSPQSASTQTPQDPAAAAAKRSQRPPKSVLENIADAVGGHRFVESRKLADDQARVRVWTSKNSGFYYCTDGSYYKSVRPGTFMAQRDALQNGYQPKLGQLCH